MVVLDKAFSVFRRPFLMPSETKLKFTTANSQLSNCVRTAHTLHVGFEVPCNSQVGCVAQPRTRLLEYAGYDLLHVGFEVSCESQVEGGAATHAVGWV